MFVEFNNFVAVVVYGRTRIVYMNSLLRKRIL